MRKKKLGIHSPPRGMPIVCSGVLVIRRLLELVDGELRPDLSPLRNGLILKAADAVKFGA
jgi:hypothetical protein